MMVVCVCHAWNISYFLFFPFVSFFLFFLSLNSGGWTIHCVLSTLKDINRSSGSTPITTMGKAKKVRQFKHKKLLSTGDVRLKKNQNKKKEPSDAEKRINRVTPTSSALFFRYNTQLGPPYHILLDTNFINFSIQNKLEIVTEMMNCLYAKCVPCITDCVVGELEKLG